ncbi:MAG: GNAT family N-acetyltransferase [Candidatus Kerfeldbacteria bacterium]
MEQDAFAVAEMIRNTYRECNMEEGSQEAIQAYLDFFDPVDNLQNIKAKFAGSQIAFVAEEDVRIVGFVRGTMGRAFNLYVDSAFHGRGIGRELMTAFEKWALGRGIKTVRVRSSLHAVPFYEKLGYKKTWGLPTKHGLRVQRMKKKIS